MRDRRLDMTMGYIVGIFVLFLAGLLMLVIFGAASYRETVKSQDARSSHRTLLSHVAVSVRNHDAEGAVAVGSGPEGDALLLTRWGNGVPYTTSLYLSRGELVEEFRRSEMEWGTGSIQKLGACSGFEVEVLDGNSLRVYLDGSSVLLHVRSGLGAVQ